MHDHETLDGCALVLEQQDYVDDNDLADFIAGLAMEEQELTANQLERAQLLAGAVEGFDTGIADRLRAAGIPTVEIPGWKTRGTGPLAAVGSLVHHTAGPADKPGARTPSLRVVIEGRSDLRGPLCQVYVGFDRVAYVVAAGSANHAGTPDAAQGVKGMKFNFHSYGLEVEHPGTFPMPADMVRLAARIIAALHRGKGIPASQNVAHWEYAPSRKIDPATNFHGPGNAKPTINTFRSMVAQELEPPPRWRWVLKTDDGKIHDRSDAFGKAGTVPRFVKFSTRTAALYVRLVRERRGPKYRLEKVE